MTFFFTTLQQLGMDKGTISLIIIMVLSLTGCAQDKNRKPEIRYSGFCYSPFRASQDPGKNIFPDSSEINEDLSFISNFTHHIRTYGCSNSLAVIPGICDKYGLMCYLGAWISSDSGNNAIEIKSLLQITKKKLHSIQGLVVGNEVLLRKDISIKKYIDLIETVRTNTDLPVGIADTWNSFENYPELSGHVDFIMVNIHPYWDQVYITDAADSAIAKYTALCKRFPNTDVIIGETGWPTHGEEMGSAVPSEENQKIFFSELIQNSERLHIPYFYFEVFDESWKAKDEGECGGHWGVFYESGKIKPNMSSFFSSHVVNGLSR